MLDLIYLSLIALLFAGSAAFVALSRWLEPK